jgi:hypothetical protein
MSFREILGSNGREYKDGSLLVSAQVDHSDDESRKNNSETSVNVFQTTIRKKPEDSRLQNGIPPSVSDSI